MKFNTSEEAKTWLRGLPLLKKDLEMKTDFYTELLRECRRLGDGASKHEGYYLEQIQQMHEKIKQLTADVMRILDTLEPEEKAVLTARYIKRMLWDAMEFHIHYSRRNAVRIHNRALEKLVGQEVAVDVYTGEL